MLLSALESSLNSLRKSIADLYDGDAGEVTNLSRLLRNLVCESSGTKGLLWRVMKNVVTDDFIDVPDMKKNLDENPKSRFAAIFIPLMDHGKWQLNGIPLEKRSLKDYIENGVAIRLLSQDSVLQTFSPDKVIITVANKMGSHVDAKIPDFLATLASLKMGKTSTLVRLIASYSMLVAEIGERVLKNAESQGFKRQRKPIILPTNSLAHTALNFNLDLPESGLQDIDHIQLPLRISSYQAAKENNPPYHIGDEGTDKMMVSVFVSRSVDIEVNVNVDKSKLLKFVFPYPRSEKTVFNLDIVWSENTVYATFEGSRKKKLYR